MSHDSWQALRSYVRDGEHPYKFCLSSFSPEDEQSIQYCSKHQDQTDSFHTSMQSSNIIYKSCVKFLSLFLLSTGCSSRQADTENV